MHLDERPPAAVTTALAPTGRITISPDTGRWSWSDGTFALHGMQPGDVVPTPALFLRHVHPDDRTLVEHAVEAAAAGPAGCEYRLVDLSGRTRTIAFAVERQPDETVTGVLIDVTQSRSRRVSELVNDQLAVALESRAVIDQAKGILMSRHGVDAQTAFGCLALISQHRNVRVLTLAEEVRSAAEAGAELGGTLFDQVTATLEVLASRTRDACRRTPEPASSGRGVVSA